MSKRNDLLARTQTRHNQMVPASKNNSSSRDDDQHLASKQRKSHLSSEPLTNLKAAYVSTTELRSNATQKSSGVLCSPASRAAFGCDAAEGQTSDSI